MSPAIVYSPPSVSVSEISSPSVNSALSTISTVAVVGAAQGYQLETSQITIASGTAPFNVITLASGEQFAPISAGQLFLSVTNAVNPSVGSAPNQGGYLQGTDFTVTVNSTNTVATVIPAGAMAAGGIINFTYEVIPLNYFYANLTGSQSAIEQQYGAAYSPAGIQTPISAAAAAVIENGQVPLILQPLFVLANPSDPTSQRLQPNGNQIGQVATWQQTLYALRSVQGINYITPAIGQSMGVSDGAVLSILEAIQDHIYYMQTQSQPNEFIFGFLGEDSTANSANATDTILQSHAATLGQRYSGAVSQNMVLLAPGSYGRVSPSNINSSALLNVGGEYAAAGYAGFAASSSITGALTRQKIANLVSVNSYRDTVTKNADAQQGLTVLEQNGQTVQIRHAITLDNSSIENRELSVVRAKFFMMSSILDALNNQVVGTIPADGNATLVVSMVVTGILDQLQAAGALVGYSNVQTRLLANDPTTVEIRFSWQPSFPINNINVIFSLDLTGATSTPTTVSF